MPKTKKIEEVTASEEVLETGEVTGTHPEYDPTLPENKQRWTR